MANCHFLGDDASIERSTPGLLSSARLGVRNVFINRRTHARSAAIASVRPPRSHDVSDFSRSECVSPLGT